MGTLSADTLINILEKYRREKGLSQERLANYIGITRNQYALIIKGKINVNEMRLSTIMGIADFFGKSIDDLVGHRIEKDPKCEWWLPGKKK